MTTTKPNVVRIIRDSETEHTLTLRGVYLKPKPTHYTV